MIRFILISYFISFWILGAAQEIQVLDRDTRQPIEHVAIINLERSQLVQTNAEGIAELSPFQEDAILKFQHPSYSELIINKKDITGSNNQVFLTEKIIKFEEIVISANKWEQDKSDIPNKITSLSPQEISFQNPPTSADLLEGSGQVFVQKSQLGGGSPMIRGFAANSVLLVVDGVRMNNAIFRSGNLQNVINIDPNILQGAEVIFGPGSVIYGSDALGGVMDFHIKDPKLSVTETTHFDGLTFTRFSSASNEKTGHVQFNIGRQKIGIFGGFSFTGLEDLETGDNRTDEFPDFGKRSSYVDRINGQDSLVDNENVNLQVPSGYDRYSVVGKLKFRPLDFLDLTYGVYYSTTSDIPRYDRLIEYINGIPQMAEWYYGPQKWFMNNLKMEFFNENKFFDESRIIIAYQDYEESRHDRKFKQNLLRNRNENVKITSINFDFDKSIHNVRQIFYGVEWIYNKVNSSAFSKDIETQLTAPVSTRYPDGGSNYNTFSAYFSYKWDLTNNLIFSAGTRYSFVKLHSEFEDTTFFDFPFREIKLNNGALNGNLGLVIKTDNQWKFDVIFSSGFRAPNVDDVGKVFDSEPGNIVVPNNDLKPEFSYNLELGITKTIREKIQIYGVGFYTILDNAMVRRNFTFNGNDSIIYDGTLSRVQALVNAGEAYIFGGSLNFKLDILDHWYFTSNLTFTTGEDRTENLPLRHTTPLFGKTTLGYRKDNMKMEFYSHYNGKREFEDLPPSEQNKTHLYTSDGSLAWYTLNLKGSYQLHSNFKVTAGIENILDRHYRPYSSGISAPGRNFLISLKANF